MIYAAAMDTVTHLVAGALTPLAFRNAPKTRMITLFGILCGELPDIDVVTGKSPEAILAFHRGITHSLVMQPFFALVMAFLFHKLLTRGDPKGAWTFFHTWSVALLALCIHLFLDCMTTFGTRIFLPFSDIRVSFPAMYIIDLSLTLPLLGVWIAILRRNGVRAPEPFRVPLARKALAWLFCYPLIALFINFTAASNLDARYAAPGNARGITRVELSPEPFSPFNWKAVAIAPDTYYMGRFLAVMPGRDIEFTAHERAEGPLWDFLRDAVPVFSLYADFVTYPFRRESVYPDGSILITFADVRYESTLPALMRFLGRNDGIFLMQVRKDSQGKPFAWRFLYRGGDAAAEPWNPVPDLPAGVKEGAAGAG